MGQVDLHANVMFYFEGKKFDTSVGRLMLREIMPDGCPSTSTTAYSTRRPFPVCWIAVTGSPVPSARFCSRTSSLGFEGATRAGISICMEDMKIPSKKAALLNSAYKEVEEIQDQYTEGLITDGERYNKVIDIWAQVTEQVAEEMMSELSVDIVTDREGKKISVPSLNAIYMMADSGARGSAAQIKQLAGMRGLMARPSGEIIETPITANFREGLDALQHFNPRPTEPEKAWPIRP